MMIDSGHSTQDDDMTGEEFDWGNDASTFGDRLSRAREFAGMDQTALARRLGVKLATIRNWESDRSEPRANRLHLLSGLLNVSIIWLMTGDGEGGPAGDEDAVADASDLGGLLIELRELQMAQSRLAARTGLIEKRLRAIAHEA